jgi:hypothetical protein
MRNTANLEDKASALSIAAQVAEEAADVLDRAGIEDEALSAFAYDLRRFAEDAEEDADAVRAAIEALG